MFCVRFYGFCIDVLERISKVIGFNYILDLVQDRKVREFNSARIRNENLSMKNKNSFLLSFSFSPKYGARNEETNEWNGKPARNSLKQDDVLMKASSFICSASGMVGVLMKHVSKFFNHANSFKWILPKSSTNFQSVSPDMCQRSSESWSSCSFDDDQLRKVNMRCSHASVERLLSPHLHKHFTSYRSSLIFVNPQGECDRFFEAFYELGDFDSLQGKCRRQKSRYLTFRNLWNDGIPFHSLQVPETQETKLFSFLNPLAVEIWIFVFFAYCLVICLKASSRMSPDLTVSGEKRRAH